MFGACCCSLCYIRRENYCSLHASTWMCAREREREKKGAHTYAQLYEAKLLASRVGKWEKSSCDAHKPFDITLSFWRSLSEVFLSLSWKKKYVRCSSLLFVFFFSPGNFCSRIERKKILFHFADGFIRFSRQLLGYGQEKVTDHEKSKFSAREKNMLCEGTSFSLFFFLLSEMLGTG